VKRFCLIANPAAGRTKHFTLLNTLRTLLDRNGLDHDLQVTQAPGLGITVAMAAAEAGYAGVIAYGGDGTVSEVASGVVETGLTMGVVPGGTMNLFAQELGVPSRLEQAVQIIAAGRTRKVEVGRVGGRYFILCAGAGIDAAVVRTLPRTVKKKIGKLAYYLRTPMAALRYTFPVIRVVTEDGITMQGAQVIISNCREYGDRFPIAPGASPFDGVMDACVFRGRRLRDFLRYWSAVRKGRHILEPDVEYYKGRRFLLRPLVEGTSIPLQIDGDYLCDLPAEVEVVPAALPVYVPD